jgi:imidazoleglycerol phosphate dehydratase HisB
MVEFFRAFAVSLAATIHIDVLRSQNAHHAMEAAAKGLALCLRQALEADRRAEGSASTKGEVLIE